MKDLYKYLKGNKNKIDIKDFKESIFNLCHQYLKSDIKPEIKTKIARLRSYIEVNFRNYGK